VRRSSTCRVAISRGVVRIRRGWSLRFYSLSSPPMSQSDRSQLSSLVVSLFRCLVNLSRGKFLRREQRIAYTNSFPLHLNPTAEERLMAVRLAFTTIEMSSN
jgi:hypothetical protein